MGYFRFFYYISYTLNTIFRLFKRHKGLIVLCLLSIALCCFFCNSSFAVDWSTTDSANLQSIKLYLSNIEEWDWSSGVLTNIKNNLITIKNYLDSLETDSEEVQDLLETANNYLRIIANYEFSIDTNVEDIRNALLGVEMEVPATSLSSNTSTGVFGAGGGSQFISLADSKTFVFDTQDISSFDITINATNILAPTPDGKPNVINYGFCDDASAIINGNIYYVSNMFNNNSQTSYSNSFTYNKDVSQRYFFLSFRFVGYNYNNLTVTAVTNSGTTENVGGFINDITNSINDTNDKIDTTNDKITTVENTITDSSINIETSLPTDTTQDITANGVDSLFTILKNAFTSSSYNTLTIQVPFTSKSFVINPNNVYGGFNNNAVTNMINLFWWYMISRFIILDIMNKINNIKGGNVENIENGNIKGDLL